MQGESFDFFSPGSLSDRVRKREKKRAESKAKRARKEKGRQKESKARYALLREIRDQRDLRPTRGSRWEVGEDGCRMCCCCG